MCLCGSLSSGLDKVFVCVFCFPRSGLAVDAADPDAGSAGVHRLQGIVGGRQETVAFVCHAKRLENMLFTSLCLHP